MGGPAIGESVVKADMGAVGAAGAAAAVAVGASGIPARPVQKNRKRCFTCSKKVHFFFSSLDLKCCEGTDCACKFADSRFLFRFFSGSL